MARPSASSTRNGSGSRASAGMLAASACSMELAVTATSADDTLIHPCMDVSVVIPAYNEARRLPATLAGWQAYLAGQPFSSEVVVVDDGSRDATAASRDAGGRTRDCVAAESWQGRRGQSWRAGRRGRGRSRTSTPT